MPRPAFWIVLRPLAGAALVVSGDFYSRQRSLPPFEPAILPLLIAFYALWARLPALRAWFPARATSVVVWCGRSDLGYVAHRSGELLSRWVVPWGVATPLERLLAASAASRRFQPFVETAAYLPVATQQTFVIPSSRTGCQLLVFYVTQTCGAINDPV
jgi:hypothetical protein